MVGDSRVSEATGLLLTQSLSTTVPERRQREHNSSVLLSLCGQEWGNPKMVKCPRAFKTRRTDRQTMNFAAQTRILTHDPLNKHVEAYIHSLIQQIPSIRHYARDPVVFAF